MTEDQWLDATYLPKLLRHLAEQFDELPDRKLRLFGVACCRRVLEWLPDYHLADVIALAERCADNPSEEHQAIALHRKYRDQQRARGVRYRLVEDETEEDRYDYFATAVYSVLQSSPHVDHVAEWCSDAICGHDNFESNRGERLFQVDLFRDIIGNPFRPVAFDPAWRTSAVVGLAQSMYDARDFVGMPVLADALQDAGCEHADLLAHCRDPRQVHVRGCWVVDLVLGKS